MNSESSHRPDPGRDADLDSRKQAIRRGLYRANTATLVALLISVGLAIATVFYAYAARRAEERTRRELWNAQRAQAMALRLSARVGRREEGLRAIAEAVRIRPSPELRDEAIATLPLVDVRPGTFWHPLPPEDTVLAVSFRLGIYAAGDARGVVRVRSMSDPALIAELSLSERIMGLEFSPDGRWLAAHSEGGSLRLWDAERRTTVRAWSVAPGDFNEHSLAFSPDSRRLAVCAPGRLVHLHVAETGAELEPLAVGGQPVVAAFDAEGARLAVGLGKGIQIWDLAERQQRRVLPVGERVLDLAWNRFTGHFALAYNDGQVVLLSPEGTSSLVLRGHTALVNRVFFDPSGAVLVSTSWDGTTRFWSAHSGWPLLVSQAGLARHFDASGERLLYSREGIGFGIWEFTRGTSFRTLAFPRDGGIKAFAVDFSPDDRWLAVAAVNGIHVFDCRTTRSLGHVSRPFTGGVAFTRDGSSLIASGPSGLIEIPCQPDPDGATAGLGEPRPVPGSPPEPFDLGFTTRGARHWFAAGSASNVVLLDLESPSAARVVPLPGKGSSLAVSPDGRSLVTSVWKGSGTRVWSLESSGPPRDLGDEGGIAAYSPDGRLLVVGTGQRFVGYDTADWRPRWEVPRDTASALSGLAAFHPDGRTIAVTHTLRQVRLLEAGTGRTVATLDAPSPERITALGFSRDGTRLAAATSHAEVHLWDLAGLRDELHALGLDLSPGGAWGPPEAPVGTASGQEAHRVPIWLSGAAAGLALVFAVVSIRHHRRLVHAYEAVETVAEQRRREVEVTQAHLVHSQKMKALGTLAAGIAHDFNNLLSIIRMSGQLVRRQLRPAGLAEQNLDAIERAVTQGKRIVGSILGYTRRPSQPQQPYAVSQVVHETLSMLNAQYVAGLVLALEIDPDTPPVRGDPSRLEQILLNLIVNAYEAMKGSGRLTISVQPRQQSPPAVLPPSSAAAYVELAVRDSGPGIDPEVLPRIFEPFFTTKTGTGEHGTGLGLTTVYAIARQDGLGLAVESEPGSGATFRVLVPAELPPPATR